MIGCSGRLRSWVSVVVNPFTSSPAMPMTTWLRPEAGHLLGLLERDRAVVDDGRDVRDGARLHVAQALALAADAADRAMARPRRSRTRAPWRTRCRCRAPCRRRGAAPRRAARCGGRNATQPPRPSAGGARHADAARSRATALDGRDRVAEPLPSRALALGHLRAPAARPSMLRSRPSDERAGRDAPRDEVVADRDEQLRLVGVEPERDHAVAERRRGGPWRSP